MLLLEVVEQDTGELVIMAVTAEVFLVQKVIIKQVVEILLQQVAEVVLKFLVVLL